MGFERFGQVDDQRIEKRLAGRVGGTLEDHADGGVFIDRTIRLIDCITHGDLP